MPLSSHRRPTGEGDVPRTRWRAATAGRAAVAARAPSGGGGRRNDHCRRCRCRRAAAAVVAARAGVGEWTVDGSVAGSELTFRSKAGSFQRLQYITT